MSALAPVVIGYAINARVSPEYVNEALYVRAIPPKTVLVPPEPEHPKSTTCLVDKLTAWRDLQELQFDRILRLETKGTLKGNRASTWRYVAGETMLIAR